MVWLFLCCDARRAGCCASLRGPWPTGLPRGCAYGERASIDCLCGSLYKVLGVADMLYVVGRRGLALLPQRPLTPIREHWRCCDDGELLKPWRSADCYWCGKVAPASMKSNRAGTAGWRVVDLLLF